MAPPSARLSWLTTPANVNGIMRAMVAEGYAPRTVQNSAWGALSKLLQHHYGKARTAAVLTECSCPTANDARDVWLTPAECHRVVSACEWEMRMALVLMASVGIDVKPLLALRVRDFDATTWGLWVPDTKNTSRKRLIHVHPVGAYVLALLARGDTSEARSGGTPLIALTRGQMNHRWRLAREAAGLTRATGFRDDVRVKDLRHTFAVHYLQGGGNLAGLMNRMGHTRGTQSLAYAKHEHRGMSDMEAAAAALGLRLPERLAAELEAIAPAPAPKTEDAVAMPAWWFDPTAPAISEAGEMRVVKTYSERGTAGFAEDPKGYAKRWRDTRRAVPADTSADSAKPLRRKSTAKQPS
jgi:integrase